MGTEHTPVSEAASATRASSAAQQSYNKWQKGLTVPKCLFLNPASAVSITCKARLDFNPEATALIPTLPTLAHPYPINLAMPQTVSI